MLLEEKNKDQRKNYVNRFTPKKCIIGVDQSYARTGVSIAVDGQLKKVTSIDLRKLYNKTVKRTAVNEFLMKAIKTCEEKFDKNDIGVIIERARTFTQSDIMNPSYIKAASAMNAQIQDMCYYEGINVYSVDTRTWKTKILGSSKPVFEAFPGVDNPQKILAVKKVIELGFEKAIRKQTSTKKKNRSTYTPYTYDDDAADSACIALFGFHKDAEKYLHIEQ